MFPEVAQVPGRPKLAKGSLEASALNHSVPRTAQAGLKEGEEPAVGIEPTTPGLRNRCSTTELRRRGATPDGMPWPGFEPGRLAALPPQDSVSTSFTTRAGDVN